MRRILFVGGLATTLSEEALENHFSEYGEVSKVKIMRDKKTKTPKCYAYITMKDPNLLPLILKDSQTIAGRKLDCQIASKKGEKKEWKEDQKKRRIFVTSLSDDHTSELLNEFFSQFGAIRSAYVIYDYHSKLSKNYGYIEFEDHEAANKALSSEVILKGTRVQCLPFFGKHEKRTRPSSDGEVDQEYFAKPEAFREDQRDSEQSHWTSDPLSCISDTSKTIPKTYPHMPRHQTKRNVTFSLARALEAKERMSESPSNYRLNIGCNIGDESRARRLDYAAWFPITQHASQQHCFVLKRAPRADRFADQAKPIQQSQRLQETASPMKRTDLEDRMRCGTLAQI